MGGHTVTHPILSTLGSREQEQEILSCRDRITEATGVAPTTFAMPNGSHRDFDGETLRILGEAGFEAACTTIRPSPHPRSRMRSPGESCCCIALNSMIHARRFSKRRQLTLAS